jgi:peptide/nickel transport system substrate-binding protein
VPFETTDAAARALRAGDVDAIAPRTATDIPFANVFSGDQRVATASANGSSVEALWFQLDDPAVGDANVRKALAYAVDREAVAKGSSGLDDPAIDVDDCGPWIPGQGPWCSAQGPFAVYAHDPARATSLLESAGYSCPAGGVCSKGAKPLVITIETLAGDFRAIAAASLIQEQALAAGIAIQIHTDIAVALFSNRAPLGRFQVALYPIGPVVDPSVTGLFSCNQIPTRVNGYGGDNWDHFCEREADRLMIRSDQELDAQTRAQELQALGRILAEQLPVLPLYALPNVAAWRSDRIAGVDPADLSSPYGLFAGLSNWYLVSTG